jgi:DNA mismatch endonuclease (patch repair protein)
MSRIRSRGNRSTEEQMVALMRGAGITGWRRQVELSWKATASRFAVAGSRGKVRSDFVFRRERVVVFVDGCFWHGCPRHAKRPKQNRTFWDAKIAGNQARDTRLSRGLRKAGWKVLRIWEHSLKKPGTVIARIHRALARSIFPVSDS